VRGAAAAPRLRAGVLAVRGFAAPRRGGVVSAGRSPGGEAARRRAGDVTGVREAGGMTVARGNGVVSARRGAGGVTARRGALGRSSCGRAAGSARSFTMLATTNPRITANATAKITANAIRKSRAIFSRFRVHDRNLPASKAADAAARRELAA
jgi:hypothetical protein